VRFWIQRVYLLLNLTRKREHTQIKSRCLWTALPKRGYGPQASQLSNMCFHSYVRFDTEGFPCCSTWQEKENKQIKCRYEWTALPKQFMRSTCISFFYVCFDDNQCNNNNKECSVDRNMTTRAWHSEDAYMGKARAAQGKTIGMNDRTTKTTQRWWDNNFEQHVPSELFWEQLKVWSTRIHKDTHTHMCVKHILEKTSNT